MEGDDELQKRLLSKLSEYGDSLLDDEDYIGTKKQRKQTKNNLQSSDKCSDHPNKTQPTSSRKSTTTRRKKNKSTGTAEERNKKTREAVDFEEELRLFKEEQLEKEQRELEEERRKEEGKMKRPPPEVILFEDPSRRKKKKVKEPNQPDSDPEDFNLKKARYEVRQFGLSGFSFEDREKCEADRAVSLGAWAPKREYINYKDYTKIQKTKKEEARQQREMDRKMGYSVAKKPTNEKIRVKNQGFWRDPSQDKKFFLDGQIGRYKQGVQVVSKNEIASVKASKGRYGGRTKKIKF